MNGIILFGDSVFFGTGAASRKSGCGKILRNLIDSPILIKSRYLDTTVDALNRIDKDVLEQQGYSKVVLLFGNNDCRLNQENLPLVRPEQFKHNLKLIIDKILASGKNALICNLQPITSEGFFRIFPQFREFIKIYSTPDDWQKKYSDICKNVSIEERIPLIDIRTPLENNIENILSNDSLHPNDLGHKIIAQEIASAIHDLK